MARRGLSGWQETVPGLERALYGQSPVWWEKGRRLEGGVDVRAGQFQGMGLGVGVRKWLGPEGQMIGGGPGGKRCRKKTLIPLGQTCRIRTEL